MINQMVMATFQCDQHQNHNYKLEPQEQVMGKSITDCINHIQEYGWKITEDHQVYCPDCNRKRVATKG